LAKQFQSRRLKKNQPIRNKNCLWRPCLLIDCIYATTKFLRS
jgi:hypothetical protein